MPRAEAPDGAALGDAPPENGEEQVAGCLRGFASGVTCTAGPRNVQVLHYSYAAACDLIRGRGVRDEDHRVDSKNGHLKYSVEEVIEEHSIDLPLLPHPIHLSMSHDEISISGLIQNGPRGFSDVSVR